MKIFEIVEDIDDLNTNFFTGNSELKGAGIGGKVKKDTQVKQNLLVRILKKISVGSLLAVIGGAAGPIGALAGFALGSFWAGSKFKNKKIKIQGKTVEDFFQETGIDKDIEAFYNKYFSESVIKNLDVNPEHIAGVISMDKQDATDMLDFGVSPKSREDIIKASLSSEMKIVRDHLSKAGKELEKIAEKHNVRPAVVSELFAKLYDNSPLNTFFITLTGSKQIFA
jgi:hypothetical protein